MKTPTGDPGSSRLPYLDGLRGWAAVVVVLCHLFPFYLLRSSGPSAEFASQLLAQKTLPGYFEYALASIGIVFYRLFTDGALPVYIFFVLSGYVLSVGYVKTKRHELIADQALRRYIRLTGPIFCASLLAFVLLKAGLMYNQRVATASGSDWIGGFYQWTPDFWGFLRFALYDVYFNYFNVPSYIFVLWTMHVEFFGSLLIFCTLAVFGALQRRWIPYGVVLVLTVFIAPDLTAFLFGLAVAEAWQNEDVRRFVQRRGFKVLMVGALGVVVCSPVWVFHHVPKDDWPIVESVLAAVGVTSVMTFASMQKALSSRISAFFGQISFSLYLIHPLVLCSFGSWYFLSFDHVLARPWLIASTALFTFALSLACARCFVVVDTWAVIQARRFAALILNRHTAAPDIHAGARSQNRAWGQADAAPRARVR
jgi:peptidoglycan/LPS O-acetylase OafA/YrhL